MHDDPLSDVLRMVRLTGAVFLDNDLSAPWSLLSAVEPDDCAPYNMVPRQLVAYHLVVEGRFLASVDGQQPVAVQAGDALILPRNHPHLMASDTKLKPANARDHILPATTRDGLPKLVMNGGGAQTRLYCGFLASDDQINPLINALPPLLTINMRDCGAFEWIESSIRFAMQELMQGRLATSTTMTRMAELLLIEAVRKHITDGALENGWLAGFRDRQIAKALAALHRDLARDWTVEALAAEAGMSRTSFSNRFSELIGDPPMKYLTTWRLRSAQAMLRDTPEGMARIAASVGYESEEAFSRAFKRVFGTAPATWRAQQGSER